MTMKSKYCSCTKVYAYFLFIMFVMYAGEEMIEFIV